jgi:glycosyltransferase involved in cell wall biosynthesis
MGINFIFKKLDMRRKKRNQMKPRVTIIIGTFRSPHLIRKSIEAVLNQSYGNFKLYIVDDNHPDEHQYVEETAVVINNFDDDRIVHIKNHVNIGVPFVYKKWISLADTEYFLISGDGDCMDPDALHKLVSFLDRRPRASFVHGMESFINDAGQVTQYERIFNKTQIVNPLKYIEYHLVGGKKLYGWGQPVALYRTEFFKVKNIPVKHYHYWDEYFHLTYLLFSEEMGYINEYLSTRYTDPDLSDWAKEYPFTSRIERLYQASKFIDEYETLLVRKGHPVNRYRLKLAIRVMKKFIVVNRTDEVIICVNLVAKNVFRVLFSYLLLILVYIPKTLLKLFIK